MDLVKVRCEKAKLEKDVVHALTDNTGATAKALENLSAVESFISVFVLRAIPKLLQ
jgi:hypothetical protein